MSYANLTFNDRNFIKRWLQRHRLKSALALVPKFQKIDLIVDYGAGNGELCKLVASQYPNARIICYEPTPGLMDEAKVNLDSIKQVGFCTDMKWTPNLRQQFKWDTVQRNG